MADRKPVYIPADWVWQLAMVRMSQEDQPLRDALQKATKEIWDLGDPWDFEVDRHTVEMLAPEAGNSPERDEVDVTVVYMATFDPRTFGDVRVEEYREAEAEE